MGKFEALESVYQEFKAKRCLSKKARFGSYSDGIFSYYFEKGNRMYEINVMCDDTLLSEMKIKSLINLKRIEYFECRFFMRPHENQEWHPTFSIRYSAHEDAMLN